MKSHLLLCAIASAMLVAPATAGTVSLQPEVANHSDVTYRVIFRNGDQALGSPTVLGQFGQEVEVEISNLMRVTMVTERPDQAGLSHTSARMAIFRDNRWQPERRMSMDADLSATPSFEHTVEGTSYRFVIMPRLVAPVAD